MIADIIVKDAGDKGLGVFALRDFAKGEFVFRRRYGRVLRNRDVASVSEEDRRHLCKLDWERSAMLLPPGCYLNHACDPNAIRKGVDVYAWEDIREGEEVTIDYRLNAFTGERWECSCGSRGCRGYVVSSFFSLSEERQGEYLPFAPQEDDDLSTPAARERQAPGYPYPGYAHVTIPSGPVAPCRRA